MPMTPYENFLAELNEEMSKHEPKPLDVAITEVRATAIQLAEKHLRLAGKWDDVKHDQIGKYILITEAPQGNGEIAIHIHDPLKQALR